MSRTDKLQVVAQQREADPEETERWEKEKEAQKQRRDELTAEGPDDSLQELPREEMTGD